MTVSVFTAHGGISDANWLIALPIVAGLVTSWQQAANGQVRVMSQSTLATTFWNFLVGTSVLVFLLLLQHLGRDWPAGWTADWWMYSGGSFGIVFIATAAVLNRHVGVLFVTLLLTLGQLAAALGLTLWFPGNPAPSLGTYLGTGLAALAVVVMLLPNRTTRR